MCWNFYEQVTLMSGTVQDLPEDPNSSRKEASDFTFFDIESGEIVSNTDTERIFSIPRELYNRWRQYTDFKLP